MPRMQFNSNSTLHHLLRRCTNHKFGYLLVRLEASRLSSGHNALSSPWLIASSLIGLTRTLRVTQDSCPQWWY